MKKFYKILSVFVVVFSMFGFAGCFDKPAPTPTPTPGDQPGDKPEPQPVVVSSISVDTENAKLDYKVGEKFTETGVKVIATFSDGHTEDLTDYCIVDSSAFNSSVVGTYTIKVSYTVGEVSVSGSFDVTVSEVPVAVVLSSISIDVTSCKLDYTVGEDFEIAGIKATATYSDGKTKDVSGDITFDSSAYDKTKAGSYIIIVKYSEAGETVIEKTSSYIVRVTEAIVDVEVTDFASAVLAAKQADVNVNEGTVDSKKTKLTITDHYTYVIGVNYLKTTDNIELNAAGGEMNRVSHFTTYLDDNNVQQIYAVAFDGATKVDPLHTVTSVDGWVFTPFDTSGFVNDRGEVVPCRYVGAGDLVKGLYDLTTQARSFKVVATMPETSDGMYKLSYEVLLDDNSFGQQMKFYYFVNLEFQLNENNTVIYFKLKTSYIQEDLPGDNVLDGFTIDPTSNEVIFASGALKRNEITISGTQSEGARTQETPYPFVPSAKEIVMVDQDGNEYHDGDSLVMTIGKSYTFKPLDSSMTPFGKAVYDKQAGAWGDGSINVTTFGGTTWLNCFNVSEFTNRLVFTYENLTMTLYLTTEYKPVTSLTIGAYVGVDSYVPTYITVADGHQIKIGEGFHLAPQVNDGAMPSFSYEILSGSCEAEVVTIANNGMDAYMITPTAAGEIKVKVTPTGNPSLAKTITLIAASEVEAPKDYSALIASGKKYTCDSNGYNFTVSFSIVGEGKEPHFDLQGTGPNGDISCGYFISYNQYQEAFPLSFDYGQRLTISVTAEEGRNGQNLIFIIDGVRLTLVAA